MPTRHYSKQSFLLLERLKTYVSNMSFNSQKLTPKVLHTQTSSQAAFEQYAVFPVNYIIRFTISLLKLKTCVKQYKFYLDLGGILSPKKQSVYNPPAGLTKSKSNSST